MAIHIFRGEGEAPLEFGDEVREVRVGRDGSWAHVRLPETATAVGRRHMTLREENGRYRLVLNRDDAVFVDGVPAHDGQEIGIDRTTEVRLGEDGPVLRLAPYLPGNLPPTVRKGRGVAGVLTRLRGVEHGRRRLEVVAIVGAVALAVVGIVVWGLAGRVDSTEARLVAWAGATQAQLRAIEDVVNQHEADTERISTQWRKDADELRTVDPGLTAYGNHERAVVAGKLRGGGASGGGHLVRASESVLGVFVRRPDAPHLSHRGTAWVFDERRLATCAHVAQELKRLEPGAVLVVRTPGSPPREFEVEAAEAHPGYGWLTRLWTENLRPITVRFVVAFRSGSEVQTVAEEAVPSPPEPCDVALLRVRTTPANPLPPPLPRAGREAVLGLEPGAPLVAIGYPSEGMVPLDVESLAPQVQRGSVTAVTNFFLGAERDATERLLVQHSCLATGGMSGAPVLDADGRVVAILNGGNVHRVLRPVGGDVAAGRIPAAVGVNFAQRVDLLEEVASGQAAARHAERQARWGEKARRLAAQFASVEEAARTLRDDQLAAWSRTAGGTPVRVADDLTVSRLANPAQSEVAGPEGELTVTPGRVVLRGEGRRWMVFAWSPTGEELSLDAGPDRTVEGRWWGALLLEGPAEVYVTGERDGPARLSVYALR